MLHIPFDILAKYISTPTSNKNEGEYALNCMEYLLHMGTIEIEYKLFQVGQHNIELGQN
jgi:hypothetical protein